MDEIDNRILRELQKDGRIPNNVLAEKVGLSPSPCLRRVKQLEESGAIDRYVAIINPVTLGLNLSIFVRIWLDSQGEETVEHFCREIRLLPEVVECHLMVGDCDFLLRVVAADLNAYRQFQIKHLARIKGVQSMKTELPMQTIKHTTELPIR
ncbi:Lrp/AsnC family transcriptional regulator [Serratia sp. Lou2A]|uniref:Lrp/AsnC family transcriptional regulator n=1 Tax=Serratia montpellierensis TaxID=2598730 RepID=A0ABS8JA70_9GAMM|nr:MULTISPECIES: Lrp/AsnC family transcriptional regulator [unclassified Serratia (in: enterobacteria)]MBH3198983.1 Lrp/AsnC family transcriptional regulator [Serratia marcescens]MCC7585089.1 Lrp/AsnC family transcriptional regulator [Serratia sp. Lou2A]MCC7660843.1 Lrp/AsnC family transcriptional regulator [Serratia sp. Pon4B]HEJ6930143.1 Lrp/AsnC family transcriptional regulator [Serratia marcescens]HEJ7072895.1 Lrp/AsnC family transcriptional regulator [Serratia marcescens]